MPRLSIVIVCWNDEALIHDAIRSVYARDALAIRDRKQGFPSARETLQHIKAVIDSKVKSVQPGS